MKVKAEVEVKKDADAVAQDDDDSFRSSLLSSSLSPPVLPSYAVDAIEAISSSSIKMKEVPSSNSCCDNNNNPCRSSSSSSSSSNPSPSKYIKTEEYADNSSKSSDDINVEEEAEEFYNNNKIFFAHTDVQQQQQQEQQQEEAITTTTDTKAIPETNNITTINSVDIDSNNDNETEIGTLGNVDDSSNGKDNEDNGDGDDLDDHTNADFGQTKGIAKQFLPAYKKPDVHSTLTFPKKVKSLSNFSKPKPKLKIDIVWDEMFEQLLVYKRQHKGSTCVPMRWGCVTKLSSWVKRQRYLYVQKTKARKEGRISSSSNIIISAERIARLNSIDFVWKVPKQTPEEITEEMNRILFPTATRRTRDDDNDDDEGTSSSLTASTSKKKMRHSNSNDNGATATVVVQVQVDSNSNNNKDIVLERGIKNGTGPSLRNTVLQRPLLEMQLQLLAYSQQKEFEQGLRHEHQQQQQEFRYHQQQYMKQQQQKQLGYQNLQQQQLMMLCSNDELFEIVRKS